MLHDEKVEADARLMELNELSVWLKTTQMCQDDRLLLSYHIMNRVKAIVDGRKE